MAESKPRDYAYYGHKKVFTRNLKRYYLALVSYGIPRRLRVLRRVSRTASGAKDYAERAVSKYRGFCEAGTLNLIPLPELPDDVKDFAKMLKDNNTGFAEAFFVPGVGDTFASDALQIKVSQLLVSARANDDLPDFNFGGEDERAGDIVMLSPFGMTVVDPNEPLPPGVGLGQVFREPSAADGPIEEKQEHEVLDWTTDGPDNDIVDMCRRMVDFRKTHAHKDEIVMVLPSDINPEDFAFCPGPDVGDGAEMGPSPINDIMDVCKRMIDLDEWQNSTADPSAAGRIDQIIKRGDSLSNWRAYKFDGDRIVPNIQDGSVGEDGRAGVDFVLHLGDDSNG